MKIFPTEFAGQTIRRVYDEVTEIWWFSVIDVVQVLTDSDNARDYWFKMKIRVKSEDGAELSTFCRQLKLPAADGKQRLTDVANAESLLRIVQSIPSPKAEPIKLWLAKVGYERMQEMADPALSLNRARETWQQHGRSDKWIAQRMTGQETRNKLTDYWSEHDIKQGSEFAILTNIIHQEWSGVSVAEHKDMKGLTSHNLRPHERGRADFYRAGRVVHPPDRAECGSHRHGREQNRCQSGWAHCPASAQPVGESNRKIRGVGREFFASRYKKDSWSRKLGER